MKKSLQAVPVAVAAVVLAACASSGGTASAPSPSAAPDQGELIVADAEYVAAVERRARDRRVQVRWVNPPLRRYPAAVASSR